MSCSEAGFWLEVVGGGFLPITSLGPQAAEGSPHTSTRVLPLPRAAEDHLAEEVKARLLHTHAHELTYTHMTHMTLHHFTIPCYALTIPYKYQCQYYYHTIPANNQ